MQHKIERRVELLSKGALYTPLYHAVPDKPGTPRIIGDSLGRYFVGRPVFNSEQGLTVEYAHDPDGTLELAATRIRNERFSSPAYAQDTVFPVTRRLAYAAFPDTRPKNQNQPLPPIEEETWQQYQPTSPEPQKKSKIRQIVSKIADMYRRMENDGFFGNTGEEWWKTNGIGLPVTYVSHKTEEHTEFIGSSYYNFQIRTVTICTATWEVAPQEKPIVEEETIRLKDPEENKEKLIPGGRWRFDTYLSFVPNKKQLEKLKGQVFTAYYDPQARDPMYRYWVDCNPNSSSGQRRNYGVVKH